MSVNLQPQYVSHSKGTVADVAYKYRTPHRPALPLHGFVLGEGGDLMADSHTTSPLAESSVNLGMVSLQRHGQDEIVQSGSGAGAAISTSSADALNSIAGYSWTNPWSFLLLRTP